MKIDDVNLVSSTIDHILACFEAPQNIDFQRSTFVSLLWAYFQIAFTSLSLRAPE